MHATGTFSSICLELKCHRVHGVAAVKAYEQGGWQGRVLGLSAGTAHTDRHINFVARSRDRMQFFFNLAAIAFQWQEVNATRQQGGKGGRKGGEGRQKG